MAGLPTPSPVLPCPVGELLHFIDSFTNFPSVNGVFPQLPFPPFPKAKTLTLSLWGLIAYLFCGPHLPLSDFTWYVQDVVIKICLSCLLFQTFLLLYSSFMGQWVCTHGCLDRKVGREQQSGQPCALCMLHPCTQAFEQSFWGVISSQIHCYKSGGGGEIVTLFSLVSPQLLADFSSRSSWFSSAAPGVVWASRQLATFSGDTSVSRERAQHHYGLYSLQTAWCVWLCGPFQPPPLCHPVQFSVFMEGIQLQTGWTRCFLIFFFF